MSQTGQVGPGSYESEGWRTVGEIALENKSRASKKKVPFGSTMDQRVKASLSDVPAPGHYQPVSPRFKDQVETQKQRSPSPGPVKPKSPPKSKKSPTKKDGKRGSK